MPFNPTPDDPDVLTARRRLDKAVLNSILAGEYGEESDPHYAAAAEHADEEVALAARDLVRAVDALPLAEQPVGWAEPAGPARQVRMYEHPATGAPVLDVD